LHARLLARVFAAVTAVSFAVAAFVIAAAFGQALQQDPAAAPDITIRTDVQQVLVQVVVTDKQGHRVTGLKSSDFEVLEDNIPQGIISLTTGLEATVMENRGERQARKTMSETGIATRPTEARVRTTYLICVDALHSSYANFSRVRSALSKFFKEEQGEDSQYGLVIIGRESVMVQPFTTDPGAVLQSVRGKEFQKAIRTSEASGLNADVANLKQMVDDYCGKCPCGPTAPPGDAKGACSAKKAEIRAFVDGTAERTATLTRSFLKQLQGVIGQLSALPTARRLLLISDGFTLEPGRELYGVLSAFMPNDPAWRFNPRDSEPELEPILRFAFARNVSVYSLDSRGVYGPGDIGTLADATTQGVFRPSAGMVQPKIDQQARIVAAGNATVMELLAQATGGAFFQNNNDLADGIRRSFADGRQYYLLAYTPTNKVMDGGFRRITVHVKDKSRSVRAKAGYWATKETMPLEPIREKPVENQPAAGVESSSAPPEAPKETILPPQPPGAPVKTDRAELDPVHAVMKSLDGMVREVSGQTAIVELADTRFVVVELSPSTVVSLAEGSANAKTTGGAGSNSGEGVELRPGLWVKVKAKLASPRAMLAESIEVASAPESKPRVRAWPAFPPTPEEQPAADADDAILKARDAALRFIRGLPDFICRQTVSRYTQGWDYRWALQDRVSSEVLYGWKDAETYRDVLINQRRTSTSLADIQGAMSGGEFGSALPSLFRSTLNSDFHFMKEVSVKGRKERIYGYRVSGERSDWVIANNYEFVVAPYSGRVWIDLQTSRVVKLEKIAAEFPKAFAFGKVDSEIEYGEIHLVDSQSYFLPIRAAAQVCSQIQTTRTCARNEIEFHDYRKYSGDSKIIFH
jgi:VWFA-related protein